MTFKCGLKKLKSKIHIDLVFKKGEVIQFGTLVMHFIHPLEVKETHIGVGVSKKFLLMAYQRNRIKRQIRAIIKKQEEKLLHKLSPGLYMVLYKGKYGVASESLSLDFEGLIKHFITYD